MYYQQAFCVRKMHFMHSIMHPAKFSHHISYFARASMCQHALARVAMCYAMRDFSITMHGTSAFPVLYIGYFGHCNL